MDAARPLGDDVGDAPGGGGNHRHEKRHGTAAGQARPGDQHQAEARDQPADDLVRTGPLAHQQGGEQDGEEHLRLHDQGGEARGHAEGERREKQAELRHAEEEAVAQDQAPARLGTRDEEHHGRAAKTNRSAARTSGGVDETPTLMTTKLSPQMKATTMASRTWSSGI